MSTDEICRDCSGEGYVGMSGEIPCAACGGEGMSAPRNHNNPPDDLAVPLLAVVEDAEPYMTGADIPDDATAEAIAALVTRADAAAKAVKAAEEAEKRPHLDATKAIRTRYAEAYGAALKKAEHVMASGKALLGKWQRAKEAARQEEARKLAEEAARRAAEARAARQAAGGDLEARLKAESDAEQAERYGIAAKAVAKMSVAPQVSGRSLRKRKVYCAEVTDVDAAIAWAWEYDFAGVWLELRPLIERMAVGEARAGNKPEGQHRLPGIVVTVEIEAY